MHHREEGEADAAAQDTAETEPVALSFDRQTHPDPADRARAWQAATSVSMETAFEADDLDKFEGSVQVRPLGPFLLVDMSLRACTVLRRRETRVKWEHDHIILDLFVTGGVKGKVGAKAIVLAAGDCLVVDLRGSMRLRIREARYIGLIIPRSMLVARIGSTASLNGLVFGAGTAEGRVFGSLLTSLISEARHLAPSAAEALAQAILDILVPCVTRPVTDQSDQQASARKPTVAQLRRFIDQHAAQPDFCLNALCSSFGLSRAALYRVFAPAGGVAEAIRRRRAKVAVRLLTRPDASLASIAEIAKASGFGTERSLRNALQDFYAASPRDIMRGGGLNTIEGEPLDRDIGRLFDDLQR